MNDEDFEEEIFQENSHLTNEESVHEAKQFLKKYKKVKYDE